MSYVVVRHHPFGRWSLVRRSIRTTEGCKECGQRRPVGSLFQYGSLQDSGHYPSWTPGHFCGIDCYRGHYGLRVEDS